MQNSAILSSMLLASTLATGVAKTQPNLVIIHTDEHNYRTLSCYQKRLAKDQAFVWGEGVNVHTPYIDRLADEGAICMNYYCSTPVSTPSRASLVSGKYPLASGALVNGMPLKEDLPTFATILRDHGYSTSYVGKWHLNESHSKNHQYQFNIKYNGGFTDNRYMMGGGHAPYFVLNPDGSVKEAVNQKEATKYPKEQLIHLTDYFTDKTIEIIKRDEKKPFAVMLSIPDPHTPDYARPPYHTMYNDMNPVMPLTMRDDIANQRPSWAGGEGTKNEAEEFNPAQLKQYFGMVKHIDDNVGRILQTLEEAGILDNTIVVFTSDHGDLFFEHKRMNKGRPYHASASIPFVIRYPEKIKAGKTMKGAYVNTEFPATILSLMGVTGYKADFDGADRSAEFMAKKDTPAMLNYQVQFAASYGDWVSLANSRYKLVLSLSDKPWLFDLEKDPYEIKNMFGQKGYEKISEEMKTELLKQIKQNNYPAFKKGRDKLILQ